MHIAADGPRVAAAVDYLLEINVCDRVVVWNPAKKAVTRIATGANCQSGPIDDLPEVALAGTRVAWLEAVGGNSLDLVLKSRALSEKKTKSIAFASNGFGGEGEPGGGWIGNLAGNGATLVYDRWSLCTAAPLPVMDYTTRNCLQPAAGDRPEYVFSKQKLLKIVNGKSGVIATAPDAEVMSFGVARNLVSPYSLAVVSVDGGWIATQAPNGAVTLYAANGAAPKQIAVPGGSFAGTALQGSRLVTLRDGNLELYNTNSGALVKSIPLAARSILRDLEDRLAVYILGRKVHVIRLSDEKDISYSPPGKGAVDAQIESSGLFYSYNFPHGNDHGRIAFVPWKKLLQKLASR